MTHSPGTNEASRASAFVPEAWGEVPDLVCGFGDRCAQPPPQTLLVRRQVHGVRVIDACEHEPTALRNAHDGLRRIEEDADALIAQRRGSVVGVRTADCVPILLVAPAHGWAAAVHAGWRGTLAGIVREVVAAARAAGVSPPDIHAALGPSIGPCCYEVSTELAGDFVRAGLAPPFADAVHPHLDLRGANRLLLEQCGVPAARIQPVGPCTRCECERFHSYRADPVSEGRQVSWIGWK